MWDLYIPFIEKGLNILKDGGLYGAIIPYPFTNQTYAEMLRRLILQDYNLLEIADLKGAKIFRTATVTNCIPIVQKGKEIGCEKTGNTIAISHIDKENNIEVAFEKTVSELVIDDRTGVWNLEEKVLNSLKHKDLHVLGNFCFISVGMVLNADEKTAKGKFKTKDLISETYDDIHCKQYIEALRQGAGVAERELFRWRRRGFRTDWSRRSRQDVHVSHTLFAASARCRHGFGCGIRRCKPAERDTQAGWIHARQVFALPGFDGGREPKVLRNAVQYNGRRELRFHQSHLFAD